MRLRMWGLSIQPQTAAGFRRDRTDALATGQRVDACLPIDNPNTQLM
jgi:hypothetical protein